ncbi:LacI family DNA-binding transcriptional regulator [Microbacterium sp. ASV49]|uniref:Substrate-binding domain-containing protein n=1 Tax=Microbacterium candidum TaxID=3041922 RepID=A0ABT7MUG3_9MICO|nr:substrate-binding domain-containing protein [Microbacterium sp. ASV49]MDL9978079.1 substrate-binding domain-containing protein [Microbacterium sp. ASV49]
MSSRRATIADVAREAGVSASTASVVFSGKTPVSDATRRKVLDAASSLGYTGPDPLAASLRRGRSGIVGVVFQDHLGRVFLDPVVTHMMDGLADAVAPLGAGLLLLRDDPAAEASSEPSITTAPIDAAVLIGCSPRLRDQLDILAARGIPVVVIEGDAGPGVARIDLDNREAQREVAQHLRRLGHTDVVSLTLPADARRTAGWIRDDEDIVTDVTRIRLAGARDVFPEAKAFAATASSIDEGFAAGRAILAAGTPTAVIAQSDLLAAGMIRAAEEAGLRVPEDLSVTGFDGVTVDGLAPYELTTMAQPATDKGRAAGEAVAARMEGRDAASFRFTCTFRGGNTTAAPREPQASPHDAGNMSATARR